MIDLPSRFKSLFFLTLIFLTNIGQAAWQQPPEQFTSGVDSSQNTLGATDGNGNAIAVWLPAGGTGPRASYYSNGVWSADQIFGPGSSPKVAMDASGNGLVIYGISSAGQVLTSFFDGSTSTWSVPSPDPLDTVDFTTRQYIAMNGLGDGVAIWNDATAGTIRSSFFDGTSTSWTAPTVIETGNYLPASVDFSSNGDAVAIWVDFITNDIAASNYNNILGNWQSPVIIGSSSTFTPSVVIDANGQAIAAWIDLAGNVSISNFNGLTWSAPQVISVVPANTGVSIAMAPGGTAVLTWKTSADIGLSSSYDGTTWGPIQQFGTSLSDEGSGYATVSVNDLGDALIVYRSSATSQILSVALPLGGVWEAPLVVKEGADVPNPGSLYSSALSNNGVGFAFWTELNFDAERPTAFASVFLPDAIGPLPPASITGSSCNNKFASQTDRVHIITWTASPDPTVTSYYLRRNGILIAIIPSTGPFIYYDHNRKNKTDVYTLTAVNGDGESTPITVILN